MIRITVLVLSVYLFPTRAVGQGIQGTHALTELAKGVYAAEGKFGGATAAIIVGDTDVLIVDSHSTPASARALLADVRQLTDRPVRYGSSVVAVAE